MEAVLLNIAIFREEFGAFRDAAVGDVDLVQDKLDRYRNTQARKALPQLVDVVPFRNVIDNIKKREEALLFGAPQKERGRAFEKLIVNPVIDITRRRNRKGDGFLPRAGAGNHHLILL